MYRQRKYYKKVQEIFRPRKQKQLHRLECMDK